MAHRTAQLDNLLNPPGPPDSRALVAQIDAIGIRFGVVETRRVAKIIAEASRIDMLPQAELNRR